MAKRRALPPPKKIVIGVFGVLLAVITLVLFFFLYEGSAKPILKVADQFQPDASWELASEKVQRPRLFCVGACPEVVRTWERVEPVTCLEFESYIPKDWNLKMEQDCVTGKNLFGNPIVSYSAIGDMENGYSAYIQSRLEADGPRYGIFMSVRKN